MMDLDTGTRRAIEEAIARIADDLEDDIAGVAVACTRAFEGRSADTTGRTQMNNLERVALSARRFGDVVAFVKRQTGRDKKAWGRPQGNGGPRSCLGAQLVDLLQRLREKVDAHCQGTEIDAHVQLIRLRVAGTCMRNLNSEYLYRVAMSAEGGR